MRCEISSKPQIELMGNSIDTKKNGRSIIFALGKLQSNEIPPTPLFIIGLGGVSMKSAISAARFRASSAPPYLIPTDRSIMTGLAGRVAAKPTRAATPTWAWLFPWRAGRTTNLRLLSRWTPLISMPSET